MFSLLRPFIFSLDPEAYSDLSNKIFKSKYNTKKFF